MKRSTLLQFRLNFILLLSFVLTLMAGGVALASEPLTPARQIPIWRDLDALALRDNDLGRRIVPRKYRLLAADMAALDALLAQAPLENSLTAQQAPLVLSLPLPDGSMGRFTLEESPIMAPALAAKFPEIKTYRGFGLDDPNASARFDRTPTGFHGLILSARGTIYIDPHLVGDDSIYVSYYKKDFGSPDKVALVETLLNRLEAEPPLRPQSTLSTGPTLRTYRLAVAANGEYSAYHNGGTANKAPVLAAITTSINRVSGIYEREVAIRLELVANNDQIIFTNAATDPYNGGTGDLFANQMTINNIIGSANYDIGHLFTVGGGGVAGLGVVCSSAKAQGLTGNSQPEGDPFDVDFVAHEIGHQFDATHTFNAKSSSAFNCDPFNFDGSTSYEPGGGTTIMAYAGICGSQDLQSNSDDYFHSASFDQIVDFVTNGGGSDCGTETATGNAAPVVEAGPNITITVSTPFSLTGSAADPDLGDTLSYAWEQYDLGTGWTQANVLPNSDVGLGPIFRSYPATSSPTRTFPNPTEPALAALGEALPFTNRTLTFRLIVRDGKGGVSYDTMQVTVEGALLLYLPSLLKQ